jgi:hypothetical protein
MGHCLVIIIIIIIHHHSGVVGSPFYRDLFEHRVALRHVAGSLGHDLLGVGKYSMYIYLLYTCVYGAGQKAAALSVCVCVCVRVYVCV